MAHLNVDVLRLICGFLTDVPDVLSLSLTCSALRPIAIAQRLSMRPITIIGTKSIRHLYHFIFADEKQRGPHIRAITIPLQPMLPDPPEELADHLLAVFASATRITKLSLYIPMVNQFRLFNHPGLLAAIAGMTTLQELTISSPTRPAIDLLWSTRSSLKVFRHSDMYGTYEEVELSHNFLVAAFDSSVCFSGARSVTITRVRHLFPLTWLLTLFPNLDRTLIVEDYIHRDTATEDYPEPLREANHKAQRAHRWAALESHRTHEANLVHVPNTDRARALLREHAPTHLALANVDISDPDGPSIQVLADTLFPPAAVARLTHPVLNVACTSARRLFELRGSEEQVSASRRPWHAVSVMWPSAVVEWAGVHHEYPQDTLLARLATLARLTHVRVVYSWGGDDRHPPLAYSHPPAHGPVYDGVRSFDFGRFVSALPRAVPSLAYIFITSVGHPSCDAPNGEEEEEEEEEEEGEAWDVSKAWRVRRPCATAVDSELEVRGFDLEELAAEEGEAVIDRERLRATEKTKWVRAVWEVDEA